MFSYSGALPYLHIYIYMRILFVSEFEKAISLAALFCPAAYVLTNAPVMSQKQDKCHVDEPQLYNPAFSFDPPLLRFYIHIYDTYI